ncbi:hypothetical protein D9613_007590 [Agrocybe pediades]|uniref:Uncharacterized protein n=1 Tax=Agrocybe pediades TaxID=84607 RepID=A0A8H4QMT8_9AGAR|nr:hypothetical protein D9613_007590 [Agrocybe pediades]
MKAPDFTRGFIMSQLLKYGPHADPRASHLSTMHDNDPDLLEREKARNLSGRTGKQFGSPHEHAPGWNEKLASSSEAAVKADRSDGTTIELQSRTVEHMKSSRAVEADEESTNSASSRDSVEGPLSGARSEVEKVIVKKGQVLVDMLGADFIEKEIEKEKNMTPSEIRVKAERNEL